MTDITVTNTATHRAESRGWLWGEHGTEPGATPSITLQADLFTDGARTDDGYAPSGIVLGRVTDSGLYGPYDATAEDGRATAAGHLFGSVRLPAGGTGRVGGALFVHGFVDPARLPVASGPGALDDTARDALSLIHYAA